MLAGVSVMHSHVDDFIAVVRARGECLNHVIADLLLLARQKVLACLCHSIEPLKTKKAQIASPAVRLLVAVPTVLATI